ncbi:DUF6705 family protein [Bacteroides intestinalis]|uniref:DUF6705 family protein n=1 Tax=Bacteroides TaxID=816 RepID=UPI00291C4F17|nr:DUF6705 family protein [Bacteroides intestinalis]
MPLYLGGFVFAQSKWNFENDITGTEDYEGLWIYQSNDTIFKLRLIKCASPKMKWHHFLGGLYSISIGGKEIDSTMPLESKFLSTSYDSRELERLFRIVARNHRTKDMEIDFSYMDFRIWLPRMYNGKMHGKYVFSENTLKLISPDKLEWKVVLSSDPNFYLSPSDAQGDPLSFVYPLLMLF